MPSPAPVRSRRFRSRWTAERRRRAGSAALLALLVYGLLELGSYGVLRYCAGLDPGYIRRDVGGLVAAAADGNLDGYNAWLRDPLLGWDFRPGWRQKLKTAAGEWTIEIGPDGARRDPAFGDARPQIAVYGASFAVCNEVDDGESWEHYLSLRLGRYVANFGGFGTGLDQSLLKYKVKHAAVPWRPTAIVVTITEEDINRIINRYRQFYTAGFVPAGFKPRFVLESGRLRLIESAAGGAAITRANLPALIAASEPDDGWWARQVALAWPYSVNLAKLVPVLFADRFGIELPSLGILPRELWRSASANALMRALIDDFVATAKARGVATVILFIPPVPQPWTPPLYAPFVAGLRRDLASDDVLVVDVAEAEFDHERFNVLPHVGHVSPYGNQVIAAYLAARLVPWLERRARRGLPAPP